MYFRHITDWSDAYTNGAHIAGGERWPAAWVEPAARFRDTMIAAGRARLDRVYGPDARQRYDLFLPEGRPRGLAAFIHGGYWKAFDKSYWSHLARGAIARGHAVALPSYRLCPEVRIADITTDVAAAIAAAAGEVEGPIALTGHSAGGHLATRMVSQPSSLPAGVVARITRVVSISGLHDLRPLMKTAMNVDLRIDAAEARAESPALLEPSPGLQLVAWVGGGERSEFIRQTELLANVWMGLGAATSVVIEPDRHHFSVIDGLTDPGHPLVGALLG
ncbi:MAG: alpha/beta hydrolase [Alphaproteobacteria bacterium]|nr:alpha/beta hydrolase [Alphaproteobacteria bacterium]